MTNNNVSLRAMTEKDTDNIVRWRNNPRVREYFISRSLFTPESHLNWFHTRVQTGEVAQFIIVDTDAGKDVGSVFLRDIDPENKKGEYGIFIGEDDCRGKGIGSAAAKLILDYAFDELKLNRVFLRVFENNKRAIRSYEKVGFKYEGTFRDDVIIDGTAYNMVYMAVLKDEWKRGE